MRPEYTIGSMNFRTEILDHNLHHGQIRYCKLDGVRNSSLHKTRPCIIIQNDVSAGNKIAVIPLSSESDVALDGSGGMLFSLEMCYEYKENKISYICPEGLVFVDRSRIDCYICQCPQDLLETIKQYIRSKIG